MSDIDVQEKAYSIMQKLQNKMKLKADEQQAVKYALPDDAPVLRSNAHKTKMHEVDVSVVECFYGIESSRVQATFTALMSLVQSSKPKPKDIVLVEAQKSEDLAVFKWTKKIGISYIFVKTSDAQDFIHLKTALWNIGAQHAKTDKLCFIDSDVVMCNEEWAYDAYEALQKLDVISLAADVCVKDDSDNSIQHMTIGHASALDPSGDLMDLRAHVGLTFGVTREAYEKMGRFNAFTSNDDVWMWGKILGCKTSCKWMPYDMPPALRGGMPLKVGYANGTCIHLRHEQTSSFQQLAVALASQIELDKPFDEIVYDPMNPEVLPMWKDSLEAKIVKLTAMNSTQPVNSIDDAVQTYLDAAGELRDINEEQCIVIYSAFVPSFKHKSWHDVMFHANAFRMLCRQPVVYVCFSNDIPEDEAAKCGIQVVKFSSEMCLHDEDLQRAEMSRTDILWPKGAMKLWTRLDDMPKRKSIVMSSKPKSARTLFV